MAANNISAAQIRDDYLRRQAEAQASSSTAQANGQNDEQEDEEAAQAAADAAIERSRKRKRAQDDAISKIKGKKGKDAAAEPEATSIRELEKVIEEERTSSSPGPASSSRASPAIAVSSEKKTAAEKHFEAVQKKRVRVSRYLTICDSYSTIDDVARRESGKAGD